MKSIILASFLAKPDRVGLKKRNKKFDPGTVPAPLGREHSQKISKNNNKKIQKIEKLHSSFISNQTKPGQAGKKKKKIIPSTVSTPPGL